jgi:hypothetical protein
VVRQYCLCGFTAALAHVFSKHNLLHYSNHQPAEQGRQSKNSSPLRGEARACTEQSECVRVKR